MYNVLAPVPRGRVWPKGGGYRFMERNETHWGDDFKAAQQGVAGELLHAPCSYEVISVGWGDGSASSPVPYHSGQFVYLHLGEWGGDEMYLYLGHLHSVNVVAGQKGQAGDVLGTMGGSGMTNGQKLLYKFAVHLHIGVAQNTKKPVRVAKKYGEPGWIDPVAWFASKGVDFNTSPIAQASKKEAPKKEAPRDLVVRQQLVSSRDKTYSGKNPVKYITIHETANTSKGANAAAHANLQSKGFPSSWHYQVDDKEAVQSFPDEVRCWHAGDGEGDGNYSSVAVEICVNSDGDYDKAVDNAAELVRGLRVKHDVPLANVVQHHHWSGKDCPKNLRKDWADFIKQLEVATPAPKPTPKPTPVGDKPWPQSKLAVTDTHTVASHAAWVELMRRIGRTHSSLTVNLQGWLKELGRYHGSINGIFDRSTTRAMQEFLKSKGHYTGVLDSSRGPMTIRAEIAYLNEQADIIRGL